MQGSVVDLAPSGSRHLCGFRQPVPSQELLKPLTGNGESDCSSQKCGASSEKLSSYGESSRGFKRGGLIDDAELSSPKKRKLSVSDTGGNTSCSSDLCTESNGCLVYVYRAAADGKESSDRESIYSVQSKVTEIVKDSSDDLWFLEEDAAADSDQFSVDVYSDEYEVVSERYSDTDSDTDNIHSSREDVIVICEESDLEFFADCEWSNIDDDSSDDDLLQGDKWFCLTCQHMNGALHRFCESCWTLRPNWLPKSSSKPQQPEHSEPFENKDSVALHVAEGDSSLQANAEYNNKLNVQSSSNAGDSRCNERVDAELNGSKVSVPVAVESRDDNCIVREQPTSSQDSGFGSLPLSVPSSSQTHPVVTPSSSDVSLVSLDKSPRDSFTVSNSAPAGEMENSQVPPPSVTASCHLPSGLCIICLSQPKEATIVHGTTGHQSCCYRCAIRLKRRRKPCPVCRRPIQTVIRNYL